MNGTAIKISAQQVEINFNESVSAEYTSDLVELARQGKIKSNLLYTKEVQKLATTLTVGKLQPVILDETGDNPQLVVESLAMFLNSANAPNELRGKRLLELNTNKLFSNNDGEKTSSVFAQIIGEISRDGKNTILFVDDLTTFAGNSQINDALTNAVEQGKIRVIGGSSKVAYLDKIAPLPQVASLFNPFEIGKNSITFDKDLRRKMRESRYRGDNVSPDLREMMAQDPTGKKQVDVIIQAKNADESGIGDFMKTNRVRSTKRIGESDTFVTNMSLNTIRNLSESGLINYVSPDRETVSTGHIEITTGATQIRSSGTANNVTTLDGSGVGIAVLDSGIWTGHSAFSDSAGQSRVVYSQNFVTGQTGTADSYGHGTHVASIAAGNVTRDNNAYRGIAYNAKIVNLKVLNNQGKGKTSNLLSALQWLYTNGQTYNVRVANLSLGTPAIDSRYNDPICVAVQDLNAVGILVVAAAGNNGKKANGQKIYGQVHSPGNDASVLTVGASNTNGTDSRSDDAIATYSSHGPTRSYYVSGGIKYFDNLTKPDMVAPGNKIIAAKATGNGLAVGNPNLTNATLDLPASDNNDMMYLSGTSMATPMVAGAAALMFQFNPKFTPTQVKMLLCYTAQPLGGYNSFEQGTGQLNIDGAVKLANSMAFNINFDGSANNLSVMRTGAPTASSTIGGTTFNWAQGVVVKGGYVKGTGLYSNWNSTFNNWFFFEDGILNETDGSPIVLDYLYATGTTAYKDIKTSNGTPLGGGTTFLSSGILISDGVLISDGTVLGDGVLISDGVLIADGVLVADGTNANTDSVLVDGDETPYMR